MRFASKVIAHPFEACMRRAMADSPSNVIHHCVVACEPEPVELPVNPAANRGLLVEARSAQWTRRRDLSALEADVNTAGADLSRNPDHYEIRFESLFNAGRALAFPCDEQGQVRLDSMSEIGRRNFQKALALVGREFATPAVMLSDTH